MAKHPVVVMMMKTELELHLPAIHMVSAVNEESGLIGMMPVYESKSAARKVWGNKV